MNRKWMPHGITAGVLAVFIALGLACGSSPPPTPHRWKDIAYTGEDTPLLEGSAWTFINTGDNYTNTREFRSGGKLVIHGFSGNHTWQRIGNRVSMLVNDGYSFYEGTYYPETKKIMGSWENSDGYNGDFTMELISGSSVQGGGARAASGSSGQTERAFTVTVWYTANGARLSSVYTVQAASKNDAEREAERMWKNQFGWNQTMRFQEAVAY